MRLKAIAATAGALLATGCVHQNDDRGEISVKTGVAVTEDGAGGYKFAYSGPFFDEKGNFDFSQKGALYNTVHLTFTITPGSASGLRFKPSGADAMWIVDKRNVGPDGSPTGPYQGDQFTNFQVSADGLTLSVTDRNDDGILYRYGLRFDLGAETVVDDPDGQNGSGQGGHG